MPSPSAYRRLLLFGVAAWGVLALLGLAGQQLYFKTHSVDRVQAAPAPDVAPRTRRLVVVVVDALRADFAFDGAVMPWLNQRKQAWGIARTGPLTLTAMAVQSIGTGANANITMALQNLSSGPTGRESFIELAHRAGFRVALFGEEAWERQFGHHADVARGWPMKGWYDVYQSDQQALDAALAELQAHQAPQLVILHLYGSDHIAHEEGVFAGGYAAKLRTVDGQLAQLEALLGPDDVLAVVSDHGVGPRGGHGGGEVEARRAPFALWGGGIRAAADLHTTQTALASTFAALLGLPLPRHAEDRVLVEALELEPAEELAWLRASQAQLEHYVGAMEAAHSHLGRDLAAATAAPAQPAPASDLATARHQAEEEWLGLIRRFDRLKQANPLLHWFGVGAIGLVLMAFVLALLQPERVGRASAGWLLAALAGPVGSALLVGVGALRTEWLELVLMGALCTSSGLILGAVWRAAPRTGPGWRRLDAPWSHAAGLFAGVVGAILLQRLTDADYRDLVEASLPFVGLLFVGHVAVRELRLPGRPSSRVSLLLFPLAGLMTVGLLFPRSWKFSYRFFERFEVALGLILLVVLMQRLRSGLSWRGLLPPVALGGTIAAAMALHYLVLDGESIRRLANTGWTALGSTLLLAGLVGTALCGALKAGRGRWLELGLGLLVAVSLVGRFAGLGPAVVYLSFIPGIALLGAIGLWARGARRAWLIFGLAVLLQRAWCPDIAFIGSGLVAVALCFLPAALPRLSRPAGPLVAAFTLVLLQMATSFLSGNAYRISDVEALAFLGGPQLHVPLAVGTILFTLFIPWLLVLATWGRLQPEQLLPAATSSNSEAASVRQEVLLGILLVLFLQVAGVFLLYPDYAANYWFVFYGLTYTGFVFLAGVWVFVGGTLMTMGSGRSGPQMTSAK